MTIAGGIMGALFHRAQTGEATTVDVSLLGVGIWSMGAAMALSLQMQVPWGPPPGGFPTGNPLVSNYATSDGGFVSLVCLQPGKYWAEMCQIIDRLDLIEDERFADAAALMANAAAGGEELTKVFAEHTADEWRQKLEPFSGQWTMVQNTLEVAADPQSTANAYIQDYATSEGCRSSWRRRRSGSATRPRTPSAPPSSTSTATRSSSRSASTGTPSST